MKRSSDQAEDEVQGAISWRLVAWLGPILLVLAFVVGFKLVYLDRVMPGVSADGVYLGGLTRAKASAAIAAAAANYQQAKIIVTTPSQSVVFPMSDLKPTYAPEATADLAMSYGRTGSIWSRFAQQVRAFMNRPTTYANFQYQDTGTITALNSFTDAFSTPVSNAAFTVSGTDLSISPAMSGKRVNTGELLHAIDLKLATMSGGTIALPTYDVAATVSADQLATLKPKAESYLSAPITLSYLGKSQTIDPATIAGWLVSSGQSVNTQRLPGYDMPTRVSLSLNQTAVQAYVSNFASKVNQKAIDGTLTVGSDGQPSVAVAGQDGRTVDQSKTTGQIMTAAAAKGSARSFNVDVSVVKPAVSQDTLAGMGITDVLSTATTYFPGSDANRITNVAVGASKFNGALIKPGGTFSFNSILGDIGPEYGYKPGWVILGNKEEQQYGGGLCQVATTAYRAALLAGFPITARTNHSYAVSWYTEPYGVPGVDATIYLPNPDLKFVNDSPGYLLIQTKQVGVNLTFTFYGTKAKYGKIRGPYFVSGSMDDTKPSHTVFYRDIYDLAGNLTHTDTVNTYYQSSLNYPLD